MGRPGQRHRGVDPNYSVTKAGEVSSNTTLPTADIESQPPWRWNER
jgi:hypothetical protein